MTVAVRTDYAAGELRRLATTSAEPERARRLLALALVLEGASRADAARSTGMDRQTLRDWVHRYNAEGLDGLHDRPRLGPQPRLSPKQEAEVARWVRQGPTLREHGVVRWRRIDLARLIEQRFGVTLAERSVGSLLRRLGFRRLSVRPRHPDKDITAQEGFKKTFPTWSHKASRRMPATSRSRSGGKTKRASASKAR